MINFNIELPYIFLDVTIKFICIISGIATAAHYHCMANFITKASHFCKLFVLPGITGSSIGLVYVSIVGNFFWMFVFSVSSLFFLVIMNLIAWRSGVYMSKYLARNKKI